jgi:isoquinoline 1-oxidoreductase subunit alpha
MAIKLIVNGKEESVDVEPSMPLLWVLRDVVGLTGTKFGCGIGQCGACTVHVDGRAQRSCQTPLSTVANKRITTIEGLSSNLQHPVQQAWLAEDVPQCGYCQSGMIMTTAALLSEKAKPTDAEIDQRLGTHICRCGTYQRIRRAIHRVAGGAQ